MKKLQNRNKWIDRLPVVNYIKRMFSKEIISPEEYKRGQQKAKELDDLRRKEILRLAKEGVEQKEIAEKFEISESYVSRIIRGER